VSVPSCTGCLGTGKQIVREATGAAPAREKIVPCEECWGLAGVPETVLSALRRYHAGTDRGELMAMLVETWGPRPSPLTAICLAPGPNGALWP
jgi:hypothetical protein